MSGRLSTIWTTNEDTRVLEIIISMTCLTGIATIFTALRFVSRIKLVETGLWWDDWLCLGGMVVSLVYFALQLIQLPYGFARHLKDLPPDIEWTKIAQIFPGIQITYFAGLGLIKCSILFFILRLDSHRLRIPVYVIMGFVAASTAAICVADILQCWPVEYIWDPAIEGHCFHRTHFWTAAAFISIFSDIIIYLLPIRTLWRVKRPLRQRLALVLIFGIGLFVVIIAFLRLQSLKKVSVTTDPTWDNVDSDLWSSAELNIAIVVACMPSFKPLAVAIWKVVRRGHRCQHQEGGNRLSSGPSCDCGFQESSEALGLSRKRSAGSATKHPEDGVAAIPSVCLTYPDVEKQRGLEAEPVLHPRFSPTPEYLPRELDSSANYAFEVTSEPDGSGATLANPNYSRRGGILKTTGVTVASSGV